MTLGKLLLPITAESDIKSSASTSFVLAARFGADVEAFYADKRNVAQQLMEEASRNKNALLVMGAYSQWRWKEWAFGGVTEYVLHETTVPVLNLGSKKRGRTRRSGPSLGRKRPTVGQARFHATREVSGANCERR